MLSCCRLIRHADSRLVCAVVVRAVMAHFEEKFVGDAVHPAAGEFRIVGDQGGGGGGGEPEPESPAVQRGEL